MLGYGEKSSVSLTTKTIYDTGSNDEFVSLLTGLAKNTTYYVRSYATNDVGTGYGNELSFNTRNYRVTPPSGYSHVDSTDYFYSRKYFLYHWYVQWYPGSNFWVMELAEPSLPETTVYIYLPGTLPPDRSATYILQPDHNSLAPGQASMEYISDPNWELVPNLVDDYRSTKGGTIKIDVVDGQVSATFDSISLQDKTSGSVALFNGHFTCH